MALTWVKMARRQKAILIEDRGWFKQQMKSCMKLGIVKPLIHVNTPSNFYMYVTHIIYQMILTDAT